MPWDSVDKRRDEDESPDRRTRGNRRRYATGGRRHSDNKHTPRPVAEATVDNITEFCNDKLKLHSYPDYGPMGLQFSQNEKVRKVASAVSVSINVIERAAAEGANLLVVHHGMFWNNESRLLDMRVGGRVRALEAHGMSLLAYHLALDAHPKIGNNILLARNLGLGRLTPWADIGWSGELGTPMDANEFYQRGGEKLGLGDGEGLFVFAGAEKIHRVAVIAGGASHYVVQAQRDGFDTFVTGEPSEPSLYLASDLKMNFIAYGHDKTERSGVQKLGQAISKKFRVDHVFLPVENPV